MAKNVCMVIIDPQVDFCDPKGALSVKGADLDCARIRDFITKNYLILGELQITLDSHHEVHIAHPCSWLDAKGHNPAPFTPITVADVESGKYRAKNPGFQERYLNYVKSLEKNGRYTLTIWPPHCLIGTPGAAMHPYIVDAVKVYESQYAIAGKITKGSNPYTEHYSALKSDVEDPKDASTKLNKAFIDLLKEFDEIIISGFATDFCVANTVRDIIDNFGEDEVKKLILFKDCTSSVVPGGENEKNFLDLFTSKGGTIMNSTEYSFN